jgi:hypothetical protein
MRSELRWSIIGGAVVVTVVVALIIGPGRAADTYRDWTGRLQEMAATVPDAELAARSTSAGDGSVLLVLSGEEGGGDAFALLTAGSEDEGATLVVIPPTLYALLPGYGEFPIGDAVSFEGAGLAVLTLENGAGIDVGTSAQLDAAELASVLGGPADIDLPNPLVVEEGDVQTVVAAEGPALRSPEAVAALFAERGTSDSLAWLERQAATWEGVVSAIGSSLSATEQLAELTPGASAETAALLALAGEALEVTILPVSQTGSGDDQGFSTRAEDVAGFVDRWLPHLKIATDRPRVEVLNGNGRLLATRAVSQVLVARGYWIVRTDNAENFEFTETIVIAQGRENMDAARQAVGHLGTGEVQLELRAPSGIVDISIIVGHDISSAEE